MYYISWHPCHGAVCTRSFETAAERDAFQRLIDCDSAKIQIWEKEA